MACEAIALNYCYTPSPAPDSGADIAQIDDVILELVTDLPKPLKHESTPPPVFRYNAIHDLESVWWVLVWILTFNESSASTSTMPKTRQEQMNLLFDGKMGNNRRLPFFNHPNFSFFPSCFSFLQEPLTAFAQYLHNTYAEVERSFPSLNFDNTAFRQLHRNCINLFPAQLIKLAMPIKLEYVKERPQDAFVGGKREREVQSQGESAQSKKRSR
ncbi:hypothetical protein GYMLUDRAFT_886921 [Collybiopsis luxurians FD-317 M1]|uniref:Fungal-type protein kinase domain-containing protein n=1 Tax=Collybiopsis luxurians FD-317 M1 TaxID=944289 RepID=A0A0D0BJZ7_9AGAR|nr:hypothetical protein GYMLUDRAFT_886921 [Collybiopsis luxurians FD-317 M1]